MASRRAVILVRRGAHSLSRRAPTIQQSCELDVVFNHDCGSAELPVLQRSLSLYCRLWFASDRAFRPAYKLQNATTLKHWGFMSRSLGIHTSRVANAVLEIGMPSLSPTMTQGNVGKWKKKEGDAISAGDVLCDIETDKATLDMESMESGFLAKILVSDGSKDIPVGQAICLMVEEKEEIASIGSYQPKGGGATAPKKQAGAPPPPPQAAATPAAPAPQTSKPQKMSLAPPAAKGARIFATPAARKLAEDKNLSLSSIKGTGPQGSIVKADVDEYIASGPSPSRGPGAAAGSPSAMVGDVNYRDIPNTQIRKITAKRLLMSKQTIPHYYLSLDTRVDKLLKLRGDMNRTLESTKKKDAPTKKISLNDFVIKAAALALKKVPECNSSWTDEYIRQYHNVNISVAVQTDHGLMVPVVRDADKKGLATISEDIKMLAGKARSNTLKPIDYEGGTFTVSNLGSFGIKQFCAIVNPPQACIIAVGNTEKRVIPDPLRSGKYVAGTYMTVTLSCDHRVIDGAVGAQWLGAFKSYIEDPITLML